MAIVEPTVQIANPMVTPIRNGAVPPVQTVRINDPIVRAHATYPINFSFSINSIACTILFIEVYYV
jgi:hypothetical protein